MSWLREKRKVLPRRERRILREKVAYTFEKFSGYKKGLAPLSVEDDSGDRYLRVVVLPLPQRDRSSADSC